LIEPCDFDSNLRVTMYMLKNQYGFQMHEVIITGIRTETSTTNVNVVITK
jgi:hypothetical protein